MGSISDIIFNNNLNYDLLDNNIISAYHHMYLKN